jgi:hypothetical protein
VVQAYIERIKEVQPLLNCVVENCFDEAIEVNKMLFFLQHLLLKFYNDGELNGFSININ